MSRLIRQYGFMTVTPTTETVTTTVTIEETIRVCEQQPVLDKEVYIVGGTGEIGTGGSVVIQGPLTELELESYLSSFPDGTVVMVITDTGRTEEVCREETITKKITRETKATEPGTRTPVFEQGWDSGADSVVSLTEDGSFQFQILSQSLNVFCGLNDASNNTDPYEIDYAFRGSRGTYTTYPGQVTGSFTDDTIFVIQRIKDEITWLVDGIRVHSQEFTGIPNELWADASLYASDDEVFNPEFIGVVFIDGEGDGELPLFTTTGRDTLRGSGEGSLLLLTTSGQSGVWGISHSSLPISTVYGQSGVWGLSELTLPMLTSFGKVGANGYGIGQLPLLTTTGQSGIWAISNAILFTITSEGMSGIWGIGDATFPDFASQGITGIWGTGDARLPALTSSSASTLWATGEAVLPLLIGWGKCGGNGYGFVVLPTFQSHANDIQVPKINYGLASLPLLRSIAQGILSFDLTGTGDGALPMLTSRSSDSANYARATLPAFTAFGREMTNSGFVTLASPIIASHGGINQWNGYCFNDPIRAQLVNGLKGTWLTESEKRIETYFGLLGSNTRELQIKYDYDAVSGVAAFVATYYQNNVPQRFELNIDLLDFVPPDLMSAGIRMDRILAHELVHAVMNDRIGTLNWPNWFNEGLCEFIHGASERVRTDLAKLGTTNLLSSLNDNVSGHAAMSSKHYSAGYLAVWKLHSVISGGIATLLASLESGSDLNTALANLTPFTSVANFLTWMTGTNGVAFVNELVNRQLFDNADTGAIGGFDVDGGVILDDESVISDTLT